MVARRRLVVVGGGTLFAYMVRVGVSGWSTRGEVSLGHALTWAHSVGEGGREGGRGVGATLAYMVG